MDILSHLARKYKFASYRQIVCIIIVAGIILRLILVMASAWRIDFDEAFNGILALRIMHGHTYLFTPPEVVGGTGSPYVLAVLFSLLGASAVTFRLLSLIWSTLYLLSTAYLAKLAYGEQLSILALLLASFAPPYMLIVGLKLWSSYIETILLGNLLIISAFRFLGANRLQSQTLWMSICGLTAGVMFWLTWLGCYYFLPVGIVLLGYGRKKLIRRAWIGIIGFLLGSLPFWIYNIPRGMPTFQRLLSDEPMKLEQVGRILLDFLTLRFPILVSGHPSWGYSASFIAIALAIAYAIGLLMVLQKAKGSAIRMMLALFIPSIVGFYCFSTHSRNALPEYNPWGIDATGRYVLMLYSVLPIGLGILINRLINWRKTVGLLALILILAINVVGVLTINLNRAFDSPYYDRLPHDLNPLIDFLETRNIHAVWVDGGIGHVLMFLTQEGILAEDYHSVFLSGGLLRLPDVLAKVQSASPTVFITPIYAGQENPPLQRTLDSKNIDYDMVRVIPTLAVYIIPQNLDPAQLAEGLGYQY